MIVIRIELHSAKTGNITELGRTYITNDGKGSHRKRNYDVRVCRKGKYDLTNYKPLRIGRIEKFPSVSKNIWCLVIQCLLSCFPEESV